MVHLQGMAVDVLAVAILVCRGGMRVLSAVSAFCSALHHYMDGIVPMKGWCSGVAHASKESIGLSPAGDSRSPYRGG